ncbi:hypothetical protein [Alkalihalobacillus sp. AL-G]|uniref:hypothetical protein n=1 Tax=Alkalihalobacillus sp. AL-G TaxID=2926399 RepID=UPI002729C7DB|nr:hypothetical protein [Alkalihalobacillus sp. AL-G]WLD94607.1 hypothetical protein MOJ78_06900 [Alkalihalobacillus sp. AL-G]
MKSTYNEKTKRVTFIAFSLMLVIAFFDFVFFSDSIPKPVDEVQLSPLFADNGEVALFSVGTYLDMSQLNSKLEEAGVHPEFSHVIGEQGELKFLQEKHPQLEIERMPAYFVFDSKGLIYKTYSYDQFVKYLSNYKY